MSKAAAGVVGFDEALKMVLAQAADLAMPATEHVSLLASEDRVLAEAVLADRDQPPFDRSTRDGFAVRAADFGDGPLKIAGQIRAGEQWQGGALEPGTAIGIMTGAPIPEGADAVVMVEHVERADGAIRRAGRADDSQRGEYCPPRKRSQSGPGGAASRDADRRARRSRWPRPAGVLR